MGVTLALLAMWCLLLMLLARLGGWTAVARTYRATEPGHGLLYRFQSGSFAWVDYNGVLTLHVSADGVRIAVLWPFRPGHPPLMIPWQAIHVVEVIERWWGRYCTMDVGAPPLARVRLPLKTVESAAKHELGNLH